MSEAIVLQTYPLKESDLIVSFLTRDLGKLRGVAKRARRPKNSFGAGLERLSQVKMSYYQRENRELVNLDSCDLLHSQFGLMGDYWSGVALDYFAEISEQLLPAAEPSERHFRLLMAVLEHMRTGDPGAVWRAVTYFSVWAVRLAGMLPELHACLSCGSALEGEERSFFERGWSGLLCEHCKTRNSWELSPASRELAARMLRTPIAECARGTFSQAAAADLRRFLVQLIESHIERKLKTAPLMEAA